MDKPGELLIGLMSGTSVDGIDAALVEFDSDSKLRVIETEFSPFSDDLRERIIFAAQNNQGLFKNHDSELHDILANHYSAASLSLLHKANTPPEKVRAIANHGQTVRHEPNHEKPFSLQLGNGQIIANQTGIKTICQFRQADISHGGQGAPLMPAFHQAVFSTSNESLVLNLGGIGNISHLGESVIGFDTGPGNCLLDQWIEKHLGKRFDENGAWAASGTIINTVLQKLLEDPYLRQAYPKSTGTDYYNLSWLDAQIDKLHSYEPRDIQATLLAFTVQSVSLALKQLGVTHGELFVCGGGAQNPLIMRQLAQLLPSMMLQKTDALGVPSDWVEAAGFAWLGYCYLHQIPSNLPSVTGAKKSVVLGQLYTPAQFA